MKVCNSSFLLKNEAAFMQQLEDRYFFVVISSKAMLICRVTDYDPIKGRINVKKITIVLAVLALAAAGCQKKQEAPIAAAPQAGAPQMPTGAAPGGDPHAGLKPVEIPAGAGHKGKVIQTMDASAYTYVEVEENGQKLWLAVMKEALVKEGVKVGDTIEFPDSPPMINFQSKELKKTFDKVIFAAGLRKAN
jgi:hypothetical protein